MVHVNANLDLKTVKVLNTGRLNKFLEDLSDDLVYITFIARDRAFIDKAKRNKGETFLWVVLPYQEVLSTNNIDLLVFQYLYQNLDQLTWMDIESMKDKLEKKIAAIT